MVAEIRTHLRIIIDIIRCTCPKEGMNQSRIRQTANIQAGKIKGYLKKISEAGLIEMRGKGYGTNGQYHITQKGREYLRKALDLNNQTYEMIIMLGLNKPKNSRQTERYAQKEDHD